MYAVIKSNSGNHSRFSRKWELMFSSNNINKAFNVLFNLALNVSDDCILGGIGDVVIDNNGGDEIYRSGEYSFSYDGRKYMIIEEKDIDLFDGGNYGYLPKSILELFNNNY